MCTGHLLYCGDCNILKDRTVLIFIGQRVQEAKCMMYTPEDDLVIQENMSGIK